MERLKLIPEDSNDRLGYVAPRHQERHTVLARGDGNRLGFRKGVTSDRHQAGDGAGGRDAREVLGVSLFRAPTPGVPLGDNPERPAEALPLEETPQLRAIAAPRCPLGVEPGEMHLQRNLPRVEDVMSFAANDPPHESSAVRQSKDNLLDWRAVLARARTAALISSRRR
jgi:hypothetical protein